MMLKQIWVIVVPAILLLASCAGLPKPENQSDALVIGSFVLDYPDGFFGETARTIETNIRLDIRNKTTDATFSVVTSRKGFFYFRSNGTDQFEVRHYSYNVSDTTGTYSGGAGLLFPIDAASNCVFYIGHLKMVAARPRMVMTGANRTSWSFSFSLTREVKEGDMVQYLRAMDPQSPWLSYEIKD
jgi:hypothetical protein